MLHGDGQYAPESLPEILAPLLAGEADAVFGSRTMIKGAARKGGMPLYKFVGNRILSRFENAALGTHLSEFHSGYRAYSVSALKQIPFEQNSDGFNFDTQIIIQLHDAGMRIAEVPIPTYYGDEICYVDGLGVCRRRHQGRRRLPAAEGRLRRRKPHRAQRGVPAQAQRGQLARADLDAAAVSDRRARSSTSGARAACSRERLRAMGHHVTGVDVNEIDGVGERTDAFFRADLNDGIPSEVGTRLRHRAGGRRPRARRQPRGPDDRQVGTSSSPDGTALFCVPNVAHWYPRFRSTLGMFDYDQRGILDSTHLRFFTRRSIRKLVERKDSPSGGSSRWAFPSTRWAWRGRLAHALRLIDHVLSRCGRPCSATSSSSRRHHREGDER